LNSEPCTWCGDDVHADDGFRAYELAGGRRAVFCRLEHIIPWAIKGSHWGAGGLTEPAGTEQPPSRCSHCAAQLGEVYVLLVRHRGGHRIADGFCSAGFGEQELLARAARAHDRKAVAALDARSGIELEGAEERRRAESPGGAQWVVWAAPEAVAGDERGGDVVELAERARAGVGHQLGRA
jgi:hypothetical protein